MRFCVILFTSLLVYFIVEASSLAKNSTCQAAGCHQNLGAGAFVHGPMKSAKGCKVCHVELKPGQGNQHPVLEKMTVASVNKTCALCHEEVEHSLNGARSVHKALGEKSCVGCHDPHRSESNKLLKTTHIVNLCLNCHKDFGAQQVRGTHHRISEMKNACLNCHEPHASRQGMKLLKASNKKDLCLKCHDKEIGAWAKFSSEKLHKPVADGDCHKCHSLHGSDQKSLLVADYGRKLHRQSDSDTQLCLKCHKDNLYNVGVVQDETQFRNGSNNLHALHVNNGKKKRNCSACHDPHGSDQGSLIRGNFEYAGFQVGLKYQKSKTGGSCATACHKTMSYDRDKAVKNETDP